MYHFFLGVLEIPACVLNVPLPLLICPLSCLEGPPSDIVLEPLPTVTPSQLYHVSHVRLPSISSLLNSHPSPSSLTYHPSPSAFSLRIDFKLAERFTRVVLRCLSPTLLGFCRSSLLLTHSILSLLLSCLLFPLGSHSGASIISQHYHLHFAHVPSAPLPFPRRSLLVKNTKFCPWYDHLVQRV